MLNVGMVVVRKMETESMRKIESLLLDSSELQLGTNGGIISNVDFPGLR